MVGWLVETLNSGLVGCLNGRLVGRMFDFFGLLGMMGVLVRCLNRE